MSARICHCGRIVAHGKCECTKTATLYERGRLPAHKRGYDHKWRKVREYYLSDHPLCEDCEEAGRITAAAEVHHKVKIADDPSRRLDVANLMALCRACHAGRTRKGE